MHLTLELSGQEFVVHNSSLVYEESAEQPNDMADGFEQYSESEIEERVDKIVDHGTDFMVSALLVGAGAFMIKYYAKNQRR